MKKVALKILLLFVIVFAINSIIHKLFVPYDWGDDVLQTKHEYFDIQRSKYNTVFVGGSLFYRHLDGYRFDSINALSGIETKSFNFGSDGNTHVKQLILVNQLLDKDQGDLKYLFFSLSSNSYFEKRNLHTKKFVTWLNWPSLKYTTKIALNENASLKERLRIVYLYTLTWIENRLNAGLGLHLVKYKLQEEKRYAKKPMQDLHLGKHLDGFRPYYIDPSVDSSELSNTDQMLYWSTNHFKRHTEFMDTIMDGYFKDLEAYEEGKGHVNTAMLKCYQDLIERTEKMGIKLIVLLPARSRLPYSTLLPIYDLLPEEHKMNMGNPNQYPAFYDYGNTFNFYHMNPSGASIYTEEVAREFGEMLN